MAYHNAFTALADPTRRVVFEHLAAAPSSVTALADKVPVSRPAVSQHLKVLSDAGLITVRAQGTRRIYAASPDKLSELRTWFDAMWDQALLAFDEAAKDEAKQTHKRDREHE